MKEYQLYIDGKFVPSAANETFDSVNPANQEIVARVSRGRSADAALAIAAARKAFDSGPWPRMAKAERATMLKKVADGITAKKAELELLEVDDSGATIRKAKEDVYLSARAMSVFAKLGEVETSGPIEGLSKPGFSRNILQREPIGVVGAITPWNFPLKMAVWKLGPALAAGNTVVLKPSEVTPVTAMELARIFHEAGFPPGVVNIVPGSGKDVGEALVRSPLVDKVSFTGSTPVGKHIMSVASESLKKCTLECGGKSANIVLADADLEMAVDGALYAIFYHQGQCCEAGSRLFLPASLHDEFVARMSEKANRMKVGDPREMGTDIGPVVSAAQRDSVMEYIKSGVGEGATIACGGGPPESADLSKGYYLRPTIFTSVKNTMKIAREEIFGPVLSVISFTNEDDAVAMANDSVYGLGGGVWSKDGERAASVANRLRAGTVWINEWHLLSEKAPFGGYKQSGIGREFGLEGLHEYMETKHVHIDEVGVRAKKTWYDTVVPKA